MPVDASFEFVGTQKSSDQFCIVQSPDSGSFSPDSGFNSKASNEELGGININDTTNNDG